jgi:hypothetical protein
MKVQYIVSRHYRRHTGTYTDYVEYFGAKMKRLFDEGSQSTSPNVPIIPLATLSVRRQAREKHRPRFWVTRVFSAGLENPDVLCFLNTTLQCIAGVSPLVQFMSKCRLQSLQKSLINGSESTFNPSNPYACCDRGVGRYYERNELVGHPSYYKAVAHK